VSGPSTARNKQVIRDLVAALDRGDLDAVERLYAPDYVDHGRSSIGAPGRDGGREAFRWLLRAFPDGNHAIDDLIAEGDRVVARVSARGTHTGELFGLQPTGKVVASTAIAIYRIEGGRIAERWVEQGPGVLEQLGLPRRAKRNELSSA
jgi:predicted ester cyclase